jgi:Fe-S cluster assembly protein SufD
LLSNVADDVRSEALQRFAATPTGREKPSRYWKYDLEGAAVVDRVLESGLGSVRIESSSSRVLACDLQTAFREHRALVDRVRGTALQTDRKFAQLALAYGGELGALVHVPADCSADDPIVIGYRADAGQSIFPHTLILLERGARATVIERIDAAAGSFVCGITEIVCDENAHASVASVQQAAQDARTIFTRAALPGRDATVDLAAAELGAALSVSDIAVTIESPGADAQVAALFFPSGDQHVDVLSAIDHRAGDATSRTIVKSAGTGAGQGRYMGNIRIAPDAQHTDAALKDDALLLSQRSHIDSIPALEIAANDVKAYHGATVGALDRDQLFYIESRGIERTLAERIITLGFFEPAIELFPTERLREELRAALEAKIA